MKVSKQAKREAKQLFELCSVNGLLDESRARQAVQALVASGHRKSLATLTHFLRLMKLDQAQHTAIVESATPLALDLQTSTQARLRRLHGPGITTSFSVRPELIGGMRIQVGSNLYDGSVLAGLAALEKSF